MSNPDVQIPFEGPETETSQRLRLYRQRLLDWQAVNNNSMEFECSDLCMLKGVSGMSGPVFNLTARGFLGRVRVTPNLEARVDFTQRLLPAHSHRGINLYNITETALDGVLGFLFELKAGAYLLQRLRATPGCCVNSSALSYRYPASSHAAIRLLLRCHNDGYLQLSQTRLERSGDDFLVEQSVQVPQGMSPEKAVDTLLRDLQNVYKERLAELAAFTTPSPDPLESQEIRSLT